MDESQRRLFIGTSLEGRARESLMAFYREREQLEALWRQGSLKPETRIRWISPDNWHVTWLFLGSQPIESLEELKHDLAEVAQKFDPFELTLDEVALWSQPGGESILVWRKSECEVGPARALHQALRPLLNWSPEKHSEAASEKADQKLLKFRPHVTLARLKNKATLRDNTCVQKTPCLPERKRRPSCIWRIDNFQLFQSRLKPEGAEHSELETFLLGVSGENSGNLLHKNVAEFENRPHHEK